MDFRLQFVLVLVLSVCCTLVLNMKLNSHAKTDEERGDDLLGHRRGHSRVGFEEGAGQPKEEKSKIPHKHKSSHHKNGNGKSFKNSHLHSVRHGQHKFLPFPDDVHREKKHHLPKNFDKRSLSSGSLMQGPSRVITNGRGSRPHMSFEFPDYQTVQFPEDVPLGTNLLLDVKLMNRPESSRIEMSTENELFLAIWDNDTQVVTLRANGRLDADDNGGFYMFKMSARALPGDETATTMVRVFTKNTNDEPPKFTQEIYASSVDETARPGALVATVIATDKDGDRINYAFASGLDTYLMFVIDTHDGVIRLHNKEVKFDEDKYDLNVIATDTGSCCPGDTTPLHTSTTLVVVSIIDVNDHKPVFENCKLLNASVEENRGIDTFVVKVTATDDDRGLNGEVTYFIVEQPKQEPSFIINSVTGDIRTNKKFDREGEDGKFVSVTVKAQDKGVPPLEGLCSFVVHILDVNDNDPEFDRDIYEERIPQSKKPPEAVFRIFATDKDSDKNAVIVYSFRAKNNQNMDLDYFHVTPDSGIVTLQRFLDRSSFNFYAVATDKGTPPRSAEVEVRIQVSEQNVFPPQWKDPHGSSVELEENATINSDVMTVKAVSGIQSNKQVVYRLLPGNSVQTNKLNTFIMVPAEEDGLHVAKIKLNAALDYETITEYNLTIRAENADQLPLASEMILHIRVKDVNDEPPLINNYEQGSVMEEEANGSRVLQVVAHDKDITAPFNTVYYQIIKGEESFEIDEVTGEVTTKAIFDREKQAQYVITVQARDGAPSSRPGVYPQPNTYPTVFRIDIGDKNDNPPVFASELYEATVKENEDINHVVVTVTATDPDTSSILLYRITSGNEGGAFGVREDSGAIFVAGTVDYESKTMYNLILVASDGLFEAETTVRITVEDVNDLPPVFEKQFYEVTLVEEDDKGLPKVIVKVKAVDGDKDRPNNIVYYLSGQGTDDPKYFDININTGEISVLKALDRDFPNGRPVWRFTVLAADEGGGPGSLNGYAEVIVTLKDINDNAPLFPDPPYFGAVEENNTAIGVKALVMAAVDYDDPFEGRNAILKYEIIQNAVENNQNIFTINEDDATIRTAVCCLDREKIDHYIIVVVARDGDGKSGTGTATINITDINDSPPRFQFPVYEIEIPETNGNTVKQEEPILVVKVEDDDLPETNQNYFLVVQGSGTGWERFSIVRSSPDEGQLKVKMALDYENPEDRKGFNFKILVDDTGGYSKDDDHTATAEVRIKLLDINDNAPEFENDFLNVSIKEDSPTGTSIAKFLATDVDNDGNSQVRYEIERSSNKRRHFSIIHDGTVRVHRTLDRETKEQHTIRVLAIDDGIPAKTATATLVVNVLDVNDNSPTFCDDNQGLVMENSDGPFPEYVLDETGKRPLIIEACDRDDEKAGNGFPFAIAMDPDAPADIQELFSVNALDDSRRANVTVIRRLDRERQRDYRVPIKISDGGNPPMVGTSTLTIIVGDRNDNEMNDGTTDILVYVFKGRAASSVIVGRVYADDPDDDDWEDKNYFWNGVPHAFFTLNETSGEITMLKGTREGVYVLNFNLEDHVRREKAKSEVTIRVKSIPEEAVYKSGSIRIKATSEEEFISIWDYRTQQIVPSKRELLRKKIAKILDTKEENVEVFTVMRSRNGMLDVRFAAHGSPYYKPEKMNGLLNQHKGEIENDLEISIEMIGIDECLYEHQSCESSCTNELVIQEKPYMITSKRTGLVGIRAFVEIKCVCIAREGIGREQCKPNSCYNDGKCKLEHNGIKCECRKGFNGPRCQQTTRSFKGDGFAWFSPLPLCENSHLSLEFMTTASNGLLFYNGPTTEPDPSMSELVQDFISLELFDGKPKLLIDFGSGTLKLEIPEGKDLNDGDWHRVDLTWEPELITMTVDMCLDTASTVQDGTQPLPTNRKMCEISGIPPGFNEFLNVNSPLQLGGVSHGELTKYMWHSTHTRQGFDGCVKNFIHNSDMYDLETPGWFKNTEPRCPQVDVYCGVNEVDPKCVNGICVATLSGKEGCVCSPGFQGRRCESSTTPSMFNNNSFVKYKLLSRVTSLENQFKTEIQLRFRASYPYGEIFYIQGERAEYMILEINNSTLQFRYNLKQYEPADERVVALPSFYANDGYWHTVNIVRFGSSAFLTVDGGGGKRYNESWFRDDAFQLMTIPDDGVILGGRQDLLRDNWHDYTQGCLDDVRFDRVSHHLPMPPHETRSDYAIVDNSSNIETGCDPGACAKVTCPENMLCENLFFLFECRCMVGFLLSEKRTCVDIDECEDDYGLCLNDGVCENTIGSFKCNCIEPYSGVYCEVQQEKHEVKLSMGALAAILASFFAILLLVLLLIIYTRNRRTNYGLVDPDEDIRENIINYNDEGGGEDDMHTYDIGPLRIPVDASGMPLNAKPEPEKPYKGPINRAYSPDEPNVEEFINNNLGKADDDPDGLPLDDLRVYAYEGGGSDAGSLSSLASGTDDNEQDFDYLNGWGPRFQKLADMYGQGESEEE